MSDKLLKMEAFKPEFQWEDLDDVRKLCAAALMFPPDDKRRDILLIAQKFETLTAALSARAAQGEPSLIQKLIEVCQRLRRGCDCIHDDRCANCDRIIEAQELAQQLQAAPPAQGEGKDGWRGMKLNPRRPFDDDRQDGYMESDSDYLQNNNELAVALLDAVESGEIASLTARVEELTEWSNAVSEAVKYDPVFESGEWAGDKEGWGYHFEVIRWMTRERLRLTAESAQLREQVKGLTKLHELAKEIREQGVDEYWKTLPDEMAILTKFDEASAALSATEREVAG